MGLTSTCSKIGLYHYASWRLTRQNKTKYNLGLRDPFSVGRVVLGAEFFLFLLQELVSQFQNATDERMTTLVLSIFSCFCYNIHNV